MARNSVKPFKQQPRKVQALLRRLCPPAYRNWLIGRLAWVVNAHPPEPNPEFLRRWGIDEAELPLRPGPTLDLEKQLRRKAALYKHRRAEARRAHRGKKALDELGARYRMLKFQADDIRDNRDRVRQRINSPEDRSYRNADTEIELYHPTTKATDERTRRVLILLREIKKYTGRQHLAETAQLLTHFGWPVTQANLRKIHSRYKEPSTSTRRAARPPL